jgi:hypothetical protein
LVGVEDALLVLPPRCERLPCVAGLRVVVMDRGWGILPNR